MKRLAALPTPSAILSRFDSRRLLGEALLASSRASLGCGDSRGSRTAALHAAKLLRGASWPTRASPRDAAGRPPGRLAARVSTANPIGKSRSRQAENSEPRLNYIWSGLRPTG